MPLPYTDEALMIVAIELLRREVANLPLAIAMNAGRTAGGPTPPGATPPASPPQPPSLTPAVFDRPQAVLIVGPRPLPVTVVGGKPGGGAPKDKEDDPGMLGKLFKQFFGTFVAMLGPVAVFAAILHSELSGIRVLVGALNLFASAIAPVLLPITFALAVALAAASDMIWRKIAPALEGFYKVMIDSVIPVIEHFADVAGKAAEGLMKIANSSLGKSALGVVGEGGFWGGLNRTISRSTEAGPDSGKSTSTQISNAVDDFARVMTGGAIDPMIMARNDLKKRLGMQVETQGGQSDEAKRARAQAELDVKREMAMQMGSQGGVGSIRGNWAAAQSAAINMTPFQAKVLERLQQTIAALERATVNPARAAYPEGGS
jgi:hypothetical protein